MRYPDPCQFRSRAAPTFAAGSPALFTAALPCPSHSCTVVAASAAGGLGRPLSGCVRPASAPMQPTSHCPALPLGLGMAARSSRITSAEPAPVSMLDAGQPTGSVFSQLCWLLLPSPPPPCPPPASQHRCWTPLMPCALVLFAAGKPYPWKDAAPTVCSKDNAALCPCIHPKEQRVLSVQGASLPACLPPACAGAQS